MSKKILKRGKIDYETGDIIDRIFLEEIATVKDNIDMISLLNNLGIEVSKNGKGNIVLCPFHDDKTPSLSIDLNKKIFNCFGCSEKGDIIDFVKKFKNTDFNGALNYLKDFNGDNTNKISVSKKPAEKKIDLTTTTPSLPEQITTEKSETKISTGWSQPARLCEKPVFIATVRCI